MGVICEINGQGMRGFVSVCGLKPDSPVKFFFLRQRIIAEITIFNYLCIFLYVEPIDIHTDVCISMVGPQERIYVEHLVIIKFL